MALLPKRRWTNSLAWSVWAQRRNNKRRAGGNIPPPLNQRYFTQLDGQSKYWRRIEPDYGQTTNATLECLFYGGGGSGAEYLVGCVGADRFYIALVNGDVVFGNGVSGGLGTTTVDSSKINHAKLVADGSSVKFFINDVLITQVAQLWTGLLDAVGFGHRVDIGTAFYSGILVSARVTTDTVDNVYGLDTNLPYDLADGTTDPLADSTLIFENGSIDQSDRLLVPEKQDGTGFVGETGINYDYATGANPETNTYSPEYSSEYA